jgi:rhodanese-related sulfurtransferase
MKKIFGVIGILGFLAVSITSFAYDNVDAKKFKEILEKEKDVVLLDVRTPEEFEKGHINGANLIPIQLFKYINLSGRGIKDKTVLVYCRSGNRSAMAARFLDQWGVKKVYNLQGGILEWENKGYKVVK